MLRSVRPLYAIALVMAGMATAQSPSPPPSTPEQVRASISNALKQRFPGTGLDDWVLGYEGLSNAATERVTAIPYNADNATNSADILAIGKKFWDRKFANGKGFSHCFPNAGKRVAVNYPQFDPRTKQVVTLEIALNRCLVLHDEKPFAPGDPAPLGPLTAYLKSLSDGVRLAVRVPPGAARDRFESGHQWFARKLGEKDLACASCHVLEAGKLYGGKGLAPGIGLTVNWPRLMPGGAVHTLHAQFRHCMTRVGAEPFAAGSDEFNNLEYFLSYLSNGAPLRTLATQRP